VLLQVEPYWVEEKIWDNQTKKHIYFNDLLKILYKSPGIKMVYTLNSHLFVEGDKSNIRFYSLKNCDDATRLIDLIMQVYLDEGRTDCLFSKDVDNIHRKFLYNHLLNLGYSKNKLYKHYSY
jgi:hypothetical protein